MKTDVHIFFGIRKDFLLDKYEDVVVVDFITADSPADKSDIRKVRKNQLKFHHVGNPQIIVML